MEENRYEEDEKRAENERFLSCRARSMLKNGGSVIL